MKEQHNKIEIMKVRNFGFFIFSFYNFVEGIMKRIRILMAKAGLDGHDRGIKVVSRALRDAGFEVIYTGLHQSPEMIVESALQEDVNLVGISVLSGAHMTIFNKVLNLLREKGRDDIVIFGGGIIPLEDMEKLKNIGVEKLFGPGTPTSEIIEWTHKKFNIELNS